VAAVVEHRLKPDATAAAVEAAVVTELLIAEQG
jgi:hypothetical protein